MASIEKRIQKARQTREHREQRSDTLQQAKALLEVMGYHNASRRECVKVLEQFLGWQPDLLKPQTVRLAELVQAMNNMGE